jgi:hypothetical protein
VGLVAERKRVFMKQRCGSVEAAFAAAQLCSLHGWPQSVGGWHRPGCGRSGGAEDVSGTSDDRRVSLLRFAGGSVVRPHSTLLLSCGHPRRPVL